MFSGLTGRDYWARLLGAITGRDYWARNDGEHGGKMWRWVALFLSFAVPSLAAETTERSKPILSWGNSASPLQSLHIPKALVPGGKLLRMVYLSGFVDRPWAETYLIETNEDGRPATVKFEIRHIGAKRNRTGAVQTEMRELTAAELSAFRTTFATLKICAIPAFGEDILDSGTVHFEFADKTRYCFAGRAFGDKTALNVFRMAKVIRGFAGSKPAGN